MRSILPLLGDAQLLQKDTWDIKQYVNQLIQEQTKQHETLVHVISIPNIIRYAEQVNRQKLNEMIDALQRSNDDLNNYSVLQRFWHNALNTNECTSTCSPSLVYHRDSLTYMRQVAIHMMDYVDAATINILSPDILPVETWEVCSDTELPSTMHLPISDDTLHF